MCLANVLISIQKASFQGVLATDHERSFAIFIYKCEDENARFSNRATIGYVTRDGGYANHEATFSNNPYSISCLDYPASQWTNVSYEITGMGLPFFGNCEFLFPNIINFHSCSSKICM